MTATLSTPHSQAQQAARTTASGAPRLDLYAPIHKALRSFMSDTLDRIGRMDVADAAGLQGTLQQFDTLMALCASHVQHENEFMHPAIEARRPGGSGRIAHDHDEHLESIAELRGQAAALRAAPAAEQPTQALRLYRHLALFVAANFQHMHIEETAHNALLWAHYSDAELLQLHGRLMASIEPHELLLVGRWMLPALNPAERAAVVGGMRAEASPEVFLGMLAHIRPHLDDKAWGQLSQAVGLPRPAAAFAHPS